MAYAVVVSLKQTLEPLLNSARSRIQIPNSELKLIYDDLCYVKSFLDKMISLEDSNRVGDLEKQIKDVVQNAQDLIESHLSDLVHSGHESSISGFSRELGEVNQKLGSLVKMLKGKEDDLTGEQPMPSPSPAVVDLADAAVISRISFDRNTIFVGLDDELIELKDRLVGGYDGLKVITITGMGGIGKTTLAKQVYFDRIILEHFDIRAFVEVNVQYVLKDLLLGLLGQVIDKEVKELTAYELGEILYKYLLGRRYLIVLDDMWSIDAWDQLRKFFPDNANGSAIILTTRITNLGVSSSYDVIGKRFLDHWESWMLLCKIAFSDNWGACPLELEEMGRAIVEKLGGLPLAIVMIAKLLSVSPITVQYWMAVAQNPISFLWESTFPAFLKLSYTQLPQRLKACFLYLGLFPPNYSIPTSQLTKLWVAEGLIEPAAELKADEYLKDLISRSLVIVHQLSSTGRIKTCRIHQLVHALCVSEARQQNIFHLVKEGTTEVSRRLGIHCSHIEPGVMESVSGVRSVVFICSENQEEVFVWFRCLRVLHALSIRFQQFPDAVLKLVRLTYLAITFDGELPPSISRLRNLEVLITHPTQTIKSTVFLPLEIWKLQKLRHLECVGFDLPDPSTGHGNDLYLKKLLTLSGVSGVTCTDGVLARMPNLIRLGIRSTEDAAETSCFDAVFTNLKQLESFKCVGIAMNVGYSLKGFPSGLIKLTLSGCGFLCDEHIAIIAQLPHLQVLKLRRSAFCDDELISDEGECFSSLNVLVLEELDLVRWRADETNFPRLRQLLIRSCYELEEIPSGIGDIPTLEVIEVDDCSLSLIASAKEIGMVQQEEYDNYHLQVRIHSSSESENNKFKL